MTHSNSVTYDSFGNPRFPGYPDYGYPRTQSDYWWTGLPGVPGNVASLDYATTPNGEQFNFGDTNETSSIILHGRVSKSTLIEIYDNGKLITTLYTGRTGKWSLGLTDFLEPGQHSIQVKISGESFPLSPALDFTIDNSTLEIAPEILTHSHTGHDFILTEDATPSLAGKGQPNSQVTIFDENRNVVAISKTDSYGNWQVDVAIEQENGRHTFTAEIAGKQSNSVSFEVAVPEPEPAFQFIGAFDYDQLQYIGEHTFTQEDRPTFEGKASSDEVIYFYEGNATEPFGSTVAFYGRWSFTPETDLVAGAHSISIRSSEGTAELHFIIEAAATEPTVITHLVDGNSFNLINEFAQITDSTPWVSGKSEAFANVSLYEGTKLLAQVAAGSDGKWFYELNQALSNGSHTLVAKTNDTISEPFTFTVNAPQSTSSGGGYRGFKSFSFSAVEVLAEEEPALFSQPAVAEKPVVTLDFAQSELNIFSDNGGLLLAPSGISGALIEETTYETV